MVKLMYIMNATHPIRSRNFLSFFILEQIKLINGNQDFDTGALVFKIIDFPPYKM